MKCHKSECKSKKDETTTRRVIRNDNSRQRHRQVTPPVNNILNTCLEMISELQAQLLLDEEAAEDSETAGYNACMAETLRYLFDQGFSADHPMVKALLEQLIENRLTL